MADSSNGHDQITVSRDALRADLAEMELRMRGWIGDQLALKADAVALAQVTRELLKLQQEALTRTGPVARQVERIQTRLEALDTGTFSRAQERAIKDVIDNVMGTKSAGRWTLSQRVMALILFLVTVGSFVLTLVLIRPG